MQQLDVQTGDPFEPWNVEKEAPKAAAFEWLKKVSQLECSTRGQCMGLRYENSAVTMIFWKCLV